VIDGADAAAAIDDAVPGLADGVPERCHHADAGDDDAPFHDQTLLGRLTRAVVRSEPG